MRTLMPVLGAVSRSEVDKVVKAKVCETIISMRPSWKSCLDVRAMYFVVSPGLGDGSLLG